MAQEIHARKTEDEIRFRIWSISSDSYVTEEMTEEKLREETLRDAIDEAITSYLREIGNRIERACTKGTSSIVDRGCELTSPWEEERE